MENAAKKQGIAHDRQNETKTQKDALLAIKAKREQLADDELINNIGMVELTDDLILKPKPNYLIPQNDEDDLIIGVMRDGYGRQPPGVYNI